jgi:hypothetical protein
MFRGENRNLRNFWFLKMVIPMPQTKTPVSAQAENRSTTWPPRKAA